MHLFRRSLPSPAVPHLGLALSADGRHITRLFLPAEIPADAAELPAVPRCAAEELASAAYTQLAEYLRGDRRRFELPLLLPPQMTAFQRRIMDAMLAIPYGETRRYGQLGPARAVGSICSRNPLPLLYPCHRVLPAHPSADAPHGLYRGGTLLKTALLRLELTGAGQARNGHTAL